MSRIAQHWNTPRSLVILGMAGFAILPAAHLFLGGEINLPGLLTISLAGAAALAIAVRHPAALITPVLFIPRVTDLPMLHNFGGITALDAACILLGAGIFLRWLFQPAPFAQLHGELNRQPHSTIPLPISTNMEKVAIPFALFAAVVALSFLYTPSPNYGAQKLIGFLSLGGSLFFLPLLICKEENSLRDFTIGTAIFGMAVAASSLSFSSSGAMGAMENPAHIGKGQVIGLAIILLLYWPITNRWLRLFVQFICIPWLVAGLISAETRGPLFSLIFVLILSFFFHSLRSPLVSRRQMLFVIAMFVAAIVLLSTFWFYGREEMRFASKAGEIAALLQGSGEAQGTAVERLVYYHAAFDLWQKRPLAGWGIGGWSMAYWQTDDRRYPHNLFLEVLAEQGAIGITALSFFLRSVFRQLRANLDLLTGKFASLLPCAIYLLAITMFSGDLDDDRFLWFWCGLISVSCALAQRRYMEVQIARPAAEVFHVKRAEPGLSHLAPGQ